MADLLDVVVGKSPEDVALRLGLVVLVIALTWLAQRLVRVLLVRVIQALLRAANVVGRFDLALEEQLSQRLTNPIRLFIVMIGIRLALLLAALSAKQQHTADHLVITVAMIAVFWALFQITDLTNQHYIQQAAAGKTRFDETVVRFVRQVINAVIMIFGLVIVLDRWGINVGAFVAGLGVLSLAVALAAQDVLGNIIAYFAIVVDAPFKVGNFIALDATLMGTVEEISFRSTRIRTRDHALVVIPNKTIANANITNWARIRKRRFEAEMIVSSTATADQTQTLIADIRQSLGEHAQVTGDPVMVQLKGLGAATFTLTVSCSVKVSSWEDFQELKLDLNLKLMSLLKQHGF
jgi:MscS family membrane protein